VTEVQVLPSVPVTREMPAGLPSCAVVDLDAVEENVATLRRTAGEAAVMAVVKADGYGHGMLPVARAALRAGAGWLGVAQFGEALALRAAGITAPVLAWLAVPGDRFADAVAAGIDVGVSAPWALAEVSDGARAAGTAARIHLKVDTGLGRNGSGAAELPALIAEALRLEAAGLVRLVGLFSHLACSDVPGHPSVPAQIARFEEAVALAERAGARLELRHLAN
jgi:alanine racemase